MWPVYGVTHFTKGTAGRDPIERVTSSLAFGALTRLVTVVTKLPDNGNHPQGARLFARAKSNIGQDGNGFYYFIEVGAIPGHENIENTHILWGDRVDGTARELLGRAEALEGDDYKSREAVEWLREALADGSCPAKDLISEAKLNGISRTTLQRAKDELKVRSTKVGFSKGWGWYLPEDSSKIPIQPAAESSGEKHTQPIDSVEDSAKVPNPRNLGGVEVLNRCQDSHEDSKGWNLRSGPIKSKVCGVTCHEDSTAQDVGIFGSNDGIFEDDEVVI